MRRHPTPAPVDPCALSAHARSTPCAGPRAPFRPRAEGAEVEGCEVHRALCTRWGAPWSTSADLGRATPARRAPLAPVRRRAAQVVEHLRGRP